MSKKKKLLAKLLRRRVLKPPEAESMVKADGWYPDPNDSGSSGHKQFVHPSKKGKFTIPFHSAEIDKDTTRGIKLQAGLL